MNIERLTLTPRKRQLTKQQARLIASWVQPEIQMYISYFTSGCPVHALGYDHADRSCSCRFDGTGHHNANIVARRRDGETDAQWAHRSKVKMHRYETGDCTFDKVVDAPPPRRTYYLQPNGNSRYYNLCTMSREGHMVLEEVRLFTCPEAARQMALLIADARGEPTPQIIEIVTGSHPLI